MYKENKINTFTEQIKKARLAAGMSQSALARVLGVKPQAVQHWENGTSSPKTERLADVARALGVKVSWFFLGEGKDLAFEPEPYEYGALTLDEKQLIKVFQSMDKTQQKTFSEIGEVMLKNKNESL